jgi:arabinofuranosyltransferase
MSGRFLAAPLFMAVLIAVHHGMPRWVSMRTAACFSAVALAALVPRTNSSGSHFGEGSQLSYIAPSGIADERAFYYQWTGLLPVLQGQQIADTRWALEGRALAAQGRRVILSRSVGLLGYYAGPTIHIVDVYALCDPLLSRLPATDSWRIGHLERRLPDGYLATLSTSRIAIQDPGLAELYRTLVAVTRMPLWTRERFAAALDLNLRGHDDLLAEWKDKARVPQAQETFGSLR